MHASVWHVVAQRLRAGTTWRTTSYPLQQSTYRRLRWTVRLSWCWTSGSTPCSSRWRRACCWRCSAVCWYRPPERRRDDRSNCAPAPASVPICRKPTAVDWRNAIEQRYDDLITRGREPHYRTRKVGTCLEPRTVKTPSAKGTPLVH